MKQLIKLRKIKQVGIQGDPIFKTDSGPYKYATFFEDIVEINGLLEKVEVIGWCSKGGEPICAIDSNKFDIKEVK